MTDTVKEEIQRARGELDLPVSQFRELPDSEAQVVFIAAETHFVSSKGRRCWWEDFRHPATKVAFPNHNGFEYLDRIIPSPNDLLWFIAEADSLPVHTVYEAKVAQIQSVIGECSFFEY